jgi:hypothetical protein
MEYWVENTSDHYRATFDNKEEAIEYAKKLAKELEFPDSVTVYEVNEIGF